MLQQISLSKYRNQIDFQAIAAGAFVWLGTIAAGISQDSAVDAETSVEPEAKAEVLTSWEFLQVSAVEPQEDNPLCDFVLGPEVFSGARLDLADLRLRDSTGAEVAYAMRIRSARNATEELKPKPFNQTVGPNNSSQVSLDLGENRVEHNEVQVELPGQNFRRPVVLDGSDDGDSWSTIKKENLMRFDVAEKKFERLTISYDPIRYRYLRLTLSPDPMVDTKAVEFGKILVRRRIEIPGEFTTRDVPFGNRQPVRADGGPGSAWIIELGGRDIPCSRLLVEIEDVEFNRDWHVEAGGPADAKEPFRRIAGGTWRRRAGEAVVPMVAEFDEVKAGRLRLVVTDYANPPLKIKNCKIEAAARVVIFAHSRASGGTVELYYGNPIAEAPNYDFARNLPPRIEPAPYRLELGDQGINPVFQPIPLPLTERWPWLIYVLLGMAVVVLGLLVLNLARTAIRLHDDAPAAATSP